MFDSYTFIVGNAVRKCSIGAQKAIYTRVSKWSIVLSAFVIISVLIKIMALVDDTLHVQRIRDADEGADRRVFNAYYLLKRKHELLKTEPALRRSDHRPELGSLAYTLGTAPATLNQTQVLLSDIIFLGLVMLLIEDIQLQDSISQSDKQHHGCGEVVVGSASKAFSAIILRILRM